MFHSHFIMQWNSLIIWSFLVIFSMILQDKVVGNSKKGVGGNKHATVYDLIHVDQYIGQVVPA